MTGDTHFVLPVIIIRISAAQVIFDRKKSVGTLIKRGVYV